jgi:hypothetical protein
METWIIYGLIAMIVVPFILALLTDFFYPMDMSTRQRYFRFGQKNPTKSEPQPSISKE